MDDISLSAGERRTLHQLEKILRRQDRLLVFRMRSAGRWAGPPKGRPARERDGGTAPGTDRTTDRTTDPTADRAATDRGTGRATRREPGRGVRALTVLSASLMLLAIRTSGRCTRRLSALAFGAVWLLATALSPRATRP
ncbi:hypothetical protein GA0115240_10536 [Streptomyces sp. DvalAA-14]|uniref:hypothetical protein n=1 Tax=unclassified Streptomyces TaxID=2593676 RepID=UPI00081B0F67|nr:MULTISPECIES: hypothetical protein [unclassified Streptomyces]MYS19129.1 hypothetical protein [Streptomyces sp. SID4948]SCD37373.1 hypothetical protein GA0115240_10536 [Streptomyces sp. DvalAA-14]